MSQLLHLKQTGIECRALQEPYWLIRIFDIVFNVCFAIELGLRLAVLSLVFLLQQIENSTRLLNISQRILIPVRQIKNSLFRSTTLHCNLARPSGNVISHQ